MRHAVTQSVEALRYKPKGRGFDSRWCNWNFSLPKYFRQHYNPGFDSVCERNEYQGYFLGSIVTLGSTQSVKEMSTRDIFWAAL